jgi:hypothetical protein
MTTALRSECQGIESVNISVNQDLYAFDKGRMYLICNPRSERAFSIARDFVSSGFNILCVSRYHPEIVRSMWGAQDFQSIWLCDRHGDSNLAARQLSRLKRRIMAFLEGETSAIVMIDGIEYLSLFNDFSKLLMFVEELNDIVMELRAILLISVDPRSFDQRSLARLGRFAEVVQ